MRQLQLLILRKLCSANTYNYDGSHFGTTKEIYSKTQGSRVSGNVNMLRCERSDMLKKACFLKQSGWYIIQHIMLIYMAYTNQCLVGRRKDIEFSQTAINKPYLKIFYANMNKIAMNELTKRQKVVINYTLWKQSCF